MGWRTLVNGERNPLHTRIAFVLVFIVGLSTLALHVLASREEPVGDHTTTGYYFGDTKYPVIFAGTAVRRLVEIESVQFFQPLFGAYRKVVNPAGPVAESGHYLRFDVPGEYYLTINGQRHLKVLVLDPQEPISAGVRRIFAFMVANLLVSNGDVPTWYRLGAEGYLNRWFRQKGPGLLLCGETDQLFRMLVTERFHLPSRMVTLAGVYRRNGRIVTSTHNVPEIYLPDVGRFVMFDLNNAFTTRSANAIDLAYRIHATTDESARLTTKQFHALGLDVYRDAPTAFLPVRWDVLQGRDQPVAFSRQMISSVPVMSDWVEVTKRFYGGVVYRGVEGYGTEFLPSDYNYGWLHEDPELRQATVDLIKTYEEGASVSVFPLHELEKMIDNGFKEELATQGWRARVPRTMLLASERTREAESSAAHSRLN